MTDPDHPLLLLAGRSVANAEWFIRDAKSRRAAIKEAGDILCILLTVDPRDDLWRATEQLCQGTMAMAMGSREGIDFLIGAVRAAQVEANEGEAA